MDIAGRLGDFPTPDAFKKALEDALHENEEINSITLSGNGEPTLHPQFEELVDIAKQLKEEYFPEAKLGILSNSSTINIEKVHRALTKLDFRIMKLDVGSLETLRKINQPCRAVDYESILSGLKSLEKVTLQTMFVDGPIRNIGDQEVNDWIERVGEIQPMKAQIYSLHRPPAASSLREVPVEKLEAIAARTEKATGVPVEVIIAKHPYRRRTSSSEPERDTTS